MEGGILVTAGMCNSFPSKKWKILMFLESSIHAVQHPFIICE